MFDKSELTIYGMLFGTFLLLFAMLFGHDILSKKDKGIEHVIKVCEETGMYLTEGKAMTCRVLKEGGKQ